MIREMCRVRAGERRKKRAREKKRNKYKYIILNNRLAYGRQIPPTLTVTGTRSQHENESKRRDAGRNKLIDYREKKSYFFLSVSHFFLFSPSLFLSLSLIILHIFFSSLSLSRPLALSLSLCTDLSTPRMRLLCRQICALVDATKLTKKISPDIMVYGSFGQIPGHKILFQCVRNSREPDDRADEVQRTRCRQ